MINSSSIPPFIPYFSAGNPKIFILDKALFTASCWNEVNKLFPDIFPTSFLSSLNLCKIAVITVVFPVPGGPCIMAISGVFKANCIASFWFSVGSYLGNKLSLVSIERAS